MIKKLSLAAIVAMGSMTAASAADLSNAIKGTSIGGFLRYRSTDTGKTSTADTQTNEYKAVLKFTKKVDENMKVVSKFVAADSQEDGTVKTPLNLTNLYLQYSKDNLNVSAGQMDVVTPLTANDGSFFANGVLASYKVSDAFTPIVAGFSASSKAGGNNIYVGAAKGTVAAVNYQAFLYKVKDVTTYSTFTELSSKVAGQTLLAQYATNKYRKKFDANAEFQSLTTLAVVGKAANVDYTGAFVHFGANGANVALGGYASGLATVGELTGDIMTGYHPVVNASALKGNALGAKVSTNVAGVTVGMDLVAGKFKLVSDSTKVNWNEYTFRASKAYNKQLKFSTYYTMASKNPAGANNTIIYRRLRFEAKYSF